MRGSLTRCVGALLSLGLGLSPRLSSQTPDTARVAAANVKLPYRYRLLGVYDAGNNAGVQGAEVVDLSTGAKSATNRSGLVSLDFLPEGGGLVRIRKFGYAPVTTFIPISPKDTTPVTEVLSDAVQTLPTVTTREATVKYVSPGLQSFERRRHEGFGHFIAEAELRKKDDVAFRDVVAMLPGLMVSCPAGSHPYHCYAASTRAVSGQAFSSGGRPCLVSVYQDGIPLQIDESDLVHMNTYDYGGVEFYAGGSEIPPEYNATGNSCGVLLLWSRER